VDKVNPISINRQCELLEVNRSSFYYVPQEASSYNQELMKLIDKQYTETPFYRVPRMVDYLRDLGYRINPKRIRRLYRLMDLHAVGPRPNTNCFKKNLQRGQLSPRYPYVADRMLTD
jgi:putative transposase